jgi:beta-galactosidase/beta-glucuronidase
MLPARWEFKTDPEDVGVIYQWYLPGSGAPWSEIDGTLYWELQGYQDLRGWAYTGKAWYRSQFAVPQQAAGKPLRLTVGGVYNTGLWIWVNGMLVDHRAKQDTRSPFDIDVTAYVRPGELNNVAVLVNTISADRSPRGGLHRRVFLWSPKG